MKMRECGNPAFGGTSCGEEKCNRRGAEVNQIESKISSATLCLSGYFIFYEVNDNSGHCNQTAPQRKPAG